MIVSVVREPEWTQRGKPFGMWRNDEADNDQAKQEPGSSSGKLMAKGLKHLVQVKQSRHAVPLLIWINKGNLSDVCSIGLAFATCALSKMQRFKRENFKTYDSGAILKYLTFSVFVSIL